MVNEQYEITNLQISRGCRFHAKLIMAFVLFMEVSDG